MANFNAQELQLIADNRTLEAAVLYGKRSPHADTFDVMCAIHDAQREIHKKKVEAITLTSNEVVLINERKKFNAMKSVRERTGESLLVVKDVVENYIIDNKVPGYTDDGRVDYR